MYLTHIQLKCQIDPHNTDFMIYLPIRFLFIPIIFYSISERECRAVDTKTDKVPIILIFGLSQSFSGHQQHFTHRGSGQFVYLPFKYDHKMPTSLLPRPSARPSVCPLLPPACVCRFASESGGLAGARALGHVDQIDVIVSAHWPLL